MFDPSLGRWINEDPIDYAGGNVNLYGYVSNNPVNRLDPSGLADKEKELSLEFETSIEKIQAQLEDGKVGYDFDFKFTVPTDYVGSRRFGLQSVKTYLITVTADGRVTRPKDADKNGFRYIIDQRDLAGGIKAMVDNRALKVEAPVEDKDKAIFVYYFVEATAGISGIVKPGGGQYKPIGTITDPTTGITTKDNYDTVEKGIIDKSTKTQLVYIYYNPGVCKNASKILTDALDINKLSDSINKTMGKFKQKFGDEGFELLSFPALFGDKNPLVGKIK